MLLFGHYYPPFRDGLKRNNGLGGWRNAKKMWLECLHGAKETLMGPRNEGSHSLLLSPRVDYQHWAAER